MSFLWQSLPLTSLAVKHFSTNPDPTQSWWTWTRLRSLFSVGERPLKEILWRVAFIYSSKHSFAGSSLMTCLGTRETLPHCGWMPLYKWMTGFALKTFSRASSGWSPPAYCCCVCKNLLLNTSVGWLWGREFLCFVHSVSIRWLWKSTSFKVLCYAQGCH